MFGHSFILRARDVPLFKTFRMAQNSPKFLFNGSWSPHPPLGWSIWGMLLTDHFHLVLSLRMSGVILLLPLFAFMTCKGTTLHVSPLSPLSKLVHCPHCSAIMLWKELFTYFVSHCIISFRNWTCLRIPFWTFSRHCSVELSASAFHPTSTVFRFLFIWFSVILSQVFSVMHCKSGLSWLPI